MSTFSRSRLAPVQEFSVGEAQVVLVRGDIRDERRVEDHQAEHPSQPLTTGRLDGAGV